MPLLLPIGFGRVARTAALGVAVAAGLAACGYKGPLYMPPPPPPDASLTTPPQAAPAGQAPAATPDNGTVAPLDATGNAATPVPVK